MFDAYKVPFHFLYNLNGAIGLVADDKICQRLYLIKAMFVVKPNKMNNRKTFVAALFCLLCVSGFGQTEIKSYVQSAVVPIISVEANSDNFSDLEPIGTAIGDAKIVMLGEQDHGDAPGYFAKARLIQYLHQKKGFTVIAFENDFINTALGWQQVRQGVLSFDNFAKYKVSINWSTCGAASPLFSRYLSAAVKTDTPLAIAGICNMTATPQALPVLDTVLTSLRLPLVNTSEYHSEILPLLHSWYKHVEDTAILNKITGYYVEIKKQMLERLPADDFWIVAVDNLIAMMKQYTGWRKDLWQDYRDRNIRDKQMTINLKWLSEVKYPGQKIIVWAHNGHVSKYAGHYQEPYLKNRRTMGTYLTEDSSLMKQTYIIGFTSYAGTAGRFEEKVYKTQKAKRGGFESWIQKAHQYAFVDFQQFNAANPDYNEPFYMKCAMTSPFNRNSKAQWNKVFDGVFYIRDNYSCNQQTDTHAKRWVVLRKAKTLWSPHF